MTNQRINDVDTITTISSTDRILVNTDVVNNVLEQIEKDDFVADIISTDANNLIEVGTDNKLFSELPTTTTLQGNTFNGNSQLIQTTSTGKYPALDGSLITNVISDFPNASTANIPNLANNVSDANNDIDFSAGFCYDLTTNVKITNTALTKRLDATFTAGTNQGGLDTGTKAISTWYHCFAISKADGTADFLYSTSATTPTMPSGYINKRRIGAIKTGTSGNIIGFIQNNNYFELTTPILDVSVLNLGTTAVLYTLSAPLNTKVKINALASHDSLSASIYLSNPNITDIAPSASVAPLFTLRNSAANVGAGGQSEIIVNSSSQIRARSTTSNTTLTVSTLGWYDNRGVN